MPLEPKQEYSSRLYAEVLCAIGAKIIDLAGQKKAGEIFTGISRPLGEKDSKKIAQILGTKRNNAASAAILAYSAADIMDVKMSIIKLDPRNSQLRTDVCPYGEAAGRQKNSILCNLCYGYSAGLVEPLGVKYVRGEMVRSGQHNSCFMTYLCMEPTGDTPKTAYTDMVVRILKFLTSKNDLLVSTFSSMLMNLGEDAAACVGEKRAILAAKNAYDAGLYLAPVFSAAIGLCGGKTDAAVLAQGAREITNCKINTYHTAEGFTLYIKGCPQRSKCTPGGFIETACTECTKGLLSKYGNYGVAVSKDGDTCKEDFTLKTNMQGNSGGK